MPGPSDISRGNIQLSMLLALTISPASVAANTTAEQLFTVPGVLAGDLISVSKPTAQAGLGIVGARASAANQIGITFSNNTAAPIVPTASQAYTVSVTRASNTTLPSAIT
jgi:hypothetical protein